MRAADVGIHYDLVLDNLRKLFRTQICAANTVAVVAYQQVKEILEEVEAGCLFVSQKGFGSVGHAANFAPLSCRPAVMVQR